MPDNDLGTIPPSGGIAALAPAQLARRTDLAGLAFATTADLAPIDGADRPAARRRCDPARQRHPGARLQRVRHRRQRGAHPPGGDRGAGGGRPRAARAVRLGLCQQLRRTASPDRDRAAGRPRAGACRRRCSSLIDDLQVGAPGDLRKRGLPAPAWRDRAIDPRATASGLHRAEREGARAKGIVILRTPMGFAMAPARDGKVVPPDQFNAWPEARTPGGAGKRSRSWRPELEQTLRAMPRLDKERRDAVRALDRETAQLRGRPVDRRKRGPTSPTCRRWSSSSTRSAPT